MTNKTSNPEVEFTPEFKRNLRTLARKYGHIRDDIEPIILQIKEGGLPGKQISGIGHKVYKVRAANRDSLKGKSGGYRIIYYIHYIQPLTKIILITIYSKTDQADISASQIRNIINESQKEK